MDQFETAHDLWIRAHLDQRTGERRGRLERGHREAERCFARQVWWALRGNFDNLHPEYEVIDWRGYSYFCDFAYITWAVKLMIEIKGFGPHVRDMDRQKYCNELNRETFLTAMGHQVISFSYDDVSGRPELCMTLLRMVLTRYQGEGAPVTLQDLAEREIVRLACRLARPLRPVDVETHLNLNRRTAVRTLQTLCDKGWFTPELGPEGIRTVRYQLDRRAIQLL